MKTYGHGRTDTDVRTQTCTHRRTHTDVQTRTYGHRRTDTDAQAQTYGHGRADIDVRTRMCRHRRTDTDVKRKSYGHGRTHTHTYTDTDLHIANSAVSLRGQKCCARCAFEFTKYSRKTRNSKRHNFAEVFFCDRGAVQRTISHNSTRAFSLNIYIFQICNTHRFRAAKRSFASSRAQLLFRQIVATVTRNRCFGKSYFLIDFGIQVGRRRSVFDSVRNPFILQQKWMQIERVKQSIANGLVQCLKTSF